jgi:tetratricopeptide (TPR) repeat protein/chaperone required for assembly of F1-ATPase
MRLRLTERLTESQELPSLTIRTEPADTSILLDGKPPESPLNNFTHVPFGSHQLSATLPDYIPIKEEIQIQKGTAPEIRLQLKPIQETAALSITTEPSGASIFLDGKPPESPSNTFTHVPFGTHHLTATLEDYEPIGEDIQVHRGMTPEIHRQLIPIQEIGSLTVIAEPSGASILLDGKSPQLPPNTFTRVPFGTHQLTATLEDYEPFKQEIQVHKGMVPQIQVQLVPKQELPKLSVIIEPPGASILLDGKPAQGSPDTFTHVPFGLHQLTATLEGYEPLKQEIQVKKGMASQIHFRLTPEQELAALSIITEPAGASIFLDGLSPQSPPDTFTHVHFGSHQVIATLNKYQPVKKNIDVRQGMTGKTKIELRPSPPDDIEWMSSLDQHGLEEARKEFAEALEIYRELSDKNPGTYRPEVARALNNLAILDGQQSHREQARQEFADALQVFRELIPKNPDMYWPVVATTLNNLASVDSELGRFEDAGKEFAEALEIRRRLAQRNPDVYAPLIAKTLNNLGVLDRRQNRIEEARHEFEEALKIYRGLTQNNREIYAPFVATTLNNLGNLALGQGRLEDARKQFSEALQIRRELAQKNPEVYLPYAATTLINLAITDSHLNRWQDAREEFAEALEIYRKLAQRREATYRPFIATTLNYLGDVDLHQGRTEDARKEYAEALQIYKSLESQDPAQFTPKATHLKKLLEELSGNARNPVKPRAHQ